MKILLLLGGLTVLFGLMAFMSKAPGSYKHNKVIAPSLQSGPVSLIGRVVCLPHKNTDGPQTMECAFGFRDYQGTYYALRDTDPEYKNISNASMDSFVTIHGNLKPESSDRYQSVGVIDIFRIDSKEDPEVSVKGTNICLPHIDKTMQSKECAMGIRTEGGVNYALDLSRYTQMAPGPRVGDILQVTGTLTANTEQFEKYDVFGVLSVTGSVVVSRE